MMMLLLLIALDSTTVSRIAVAPHESLTVRTTTPTSTSTDGGAPVVLLPGLLGGTFAFRKVTPVIAAAGHPTFVIEPLGVGTSSHPDDGDYSLDAQADRIAAVLDTFAVTNAVIVGSNFGASVALRVAYRHPERVAAVLLLDGGPVDRSSTAGASIALRFAPVLKLFGGRGMARRRIGEAMRQYSADPSWVTDSVVEEYARPIANDLGGAGRVLSAMRRATVAAPLAENLWRIRQPVRLLIGAANRRGGIEGDETSLLEARIRDFAVDSVAASGSYVHEERPEVVAHAILTLARAIPGAVVVTVIPPEHAEP
ncbi:MAG: alpha/beta hydrolase [Gemmatimonadota bacterium]|nr:alpha/beta hydrolase [Gemmatimonadota bacterium]